MLKAILSTHGVLGINARNLLYVKPFNPKKAVAFADDKLKTKAFLTARGVPAARIYARIETRSQLRSFDFGQLPNECVLKPNYGFGGEGIVILKGRNKHGDFLKTDGSAITAKELVAHIEDILDGKFSLGGRTDTAFFEQILFSHDCFAPFRPVGLPDLRIIVFNLVPVMAMLRVPTASSEGKANLHLGGLGIGIDIAKGTTTHGVRYGKILEELPHGIAPSGHQIPYWDDILLICSRIQQITNIGYIAVDITIDQTIGPALLEVNARAGLDVQIANLAPLRQRLERVKGIKVGSPEKGVRLGQDLFGEKVRKSAAESVRQPILGLQESITIVGPGRNFEEPVLVAPHEDRTVFTAAFADILENQGAVEPDPEGKGYRVKFSLGGRKMQTLVGTVPDLPDGLRVRLGRRDLAGFLIDPSKQKSNRPISAAARSDLRAVDKLIAQIDRDLLALKYLKPTNLEVERSRLLEDERYNPVFTYRELDFDPQDVRKRLAEPISDGSPLAQLLEKKRIELLRRLAMLQARGDADLFTESSVELFGKPTSSLLRAAQAALHNRDACTVPDVTQKDLSAQQVKKRFDEVLVNYGLHAWKVEIRDTLVADCTVGGGNVYIRADAQFAPERVEALIKHEIETHVLTAENGEHQPYELLRRGTAGYLDTQEGLGTFNQNRVYGPNHEKRYSAPGNLLGLHFALEHSFAQTRAYLRDELGYDADKALTQAIALKRGLADTSQQGAFTKSIVYFRGLRAVEKFIETSDIRRLYIGKVSVEDLALIEQIQGIQPPLLLPDFLRSDRPSPTGSRRRTTPAARKRG